MSSEHSNQSTGESGKARGGAVPSPFRRGSMRALAPASVVAIVAAGAAIAPSVASASPALPQISAQNLLAKAAQSKVDAFSGTVAMTTNLGLPALPDLAGGANPLSLLSGTHTLQVAADGPTKQRLALLDTMSEYDLIHNGKDVWVYDSEQNSVGHATSTDSGVQHDKSDKTKDGSAVPLTPQQAAQKFIDAVTPTTNVSVDRTQSVAGRGAYTLRLTPKQKGSLIGRVEIAIDAQNGAALRVAVYPTGSNTAAFEVGFTSVSFSAPPASRFNFTPPKGAKVSPLTGPGSGLGTQARQGTNSADLAPQVLGADWLSVVELHGIDLNQLKAAASQSSGDQRRGGGNDTGLFNGDPSSYLNALLGAGKSVSGGFGTGKLYTTNFLSILLTDDGRLFAGPVTPAVLEADASAQGRK